ncbi:type VI secretion system baseplate subunit TssG [Pendulispora rubella]|uniref:Type VI secretion system baseplate subunit TssG n=1 Tax=Pendulispora rubella TaxID=2741070 RepID=A0ABZ2LCD5_9BACT
MARFPQGAVAALTRAAEQFARAHPALLGHLGRAPSSLALDRVRRGVYALAASIIERIHRFQADSHRALAEVVAASSMRPFPAATIVELSLAGSESKQRVPAHAEISPPNDPACRFRLVSHVDVGAYRVENARAHGRLVQFDLIATSDAPLQDALDDELRLYVDGPREKALLLLMHVLGATERVDVQISNGPSKQAGNVEPYGFDERDVLAPEPDGPMVTDAFVQEYFVFPEKFMFFVVRGVLSALHGTAAPVRKATVTLRLDAPLPGDLAIGPDALRAHCVPAVNLFETTSEPQTFGPGKSTFPLRVAGVPRRRGEVFAVLSVTAAPCVGEGEIPLPSLRRFRAGDFHDAFPYAYSTERKVQRSDLPPELFMTLTSSRGTEPLLEPHVISSRVLATNGACRVSVGELTEPGHGFPRAVRARNLLPTSSHVPALTGFDLALRAFAKGAIPKGDPWFALRTFLASLLPPETADPGAFRANLQRIEAIEGFEVRPRAGAGGSGRGYLASLTLDETPLRGLGDVALFLRVLHATLDAQVGLNGLYRCEALCRKSGTRLEWPTREPAPRPHRHPCPEYARKAKREAFVATSARPRASRMALESMVRTASRYGFFELARLLEHTTSTDLEHTERVQFTQRPSLAFPAGEVASVAPATNDSVQVELNFLGLVGTSAPLAAQFTEEVRYGDDEGALRAFYDVIHHALAVRLYGAWKASSIEGGFDLEGGDLQSQVLRSVAGIDAPSALEEEPLPPMLALGLADYQRGQPHDINLRGAEALLQHLLPWPISLEANVHRFLPLGDNETAHLGGQCSRLGVDFVYGETRSDREGAIRLHIGPVDRATHESMMPGGDVYAKLERLTSRVFGAKVLVELEVHLAADDTPRWTLGGASALGVDTRYTIADETVHVRAPLLPEPHQARCEFVPMTA